MAELKHAHAMLRKEAKATINEDQLFAMHERQTQILTTATKATKAARCWPMLERGQTTKKGFREQWNRKPG